MINFVSNLPPGLRTGGFSAMNAAAYEAISRVEEINYVGPINPPTSFRMKTVSKLKRTLGLPGNFSFFSPERLATIAADVNLRCSMTARLDFFQGITPWILTSPPRPYVVWSDCTFHDYMTIYHQRQLFRSTDLERIEKKEAEWLRGAQCVAFSSQWAAKRCVECYGLKVCLVHSVGIFGEIEMPERDEYKGEKQFVFVSTDFHAKGGTLVLAALRRVREHDPDASLVIVGAAPPSEYLGPNVIYAGYLKKEDPEQRKQFRKILTTSCALVHPTRSDIAPLVIIEAGYFGCPTISVRKFAIPEQIEHQVTGLLIDDPAEPLALAEAMMWMIENKAGYVEMRNQARLKACADRSREVFSQRLGALVAPSYHNNENTLSRRN